MIDIALSSWSLHTQFLNPHISNVTAQNFPRLAREIFGVRCIEFYEGDYASDFLSSAVDADYACRIRKACEEACVRVACVAAANDLTNPDEKIVLQDLARIAKWSEHCQILGCGIIRINTGRLCLNRDRARLLASRLKVLVKQTSKADLILALENHPHLIENDSDTELLLSVLEKVGSTRVRLCPDVGAVGVGYWRRALDKLAPFAAHIHLKPTVSEIDSRGQLVYRSILEYGPVLKQVLDRHRFKGAVSFEYTAYQHLEADPQLESARALESVSKAFGVPLTPSRNSGQSTTGNATPEVEVNDDRELAPTARILKILADGCESNLEAGIGIHDFATERHILSVHASHYPEEANGHTRPQSFCALIRQGSAAKHLCIDFHAQLLQRIRKGIQCLPQVHICPMGLMVLSMPIKDARHLYGAISCGTWVEQGTEGMVFESIAAHTEDTPDLRSQESALLYELPTYSVSKLRKSQILLEALAKDLSGLYEDKLEEKNRLTRGTQIIASLRKSASKASLDDFVAALPALFEEFLEVVGFGQIGLYKRTSERDEDPDEYELQVVTNSGSLQPILRIPRVSGGSTEGEARMSHGLLEAWASEVVGLKYLFAEGQHPTEAIVFAAGQGSVSSSIANLLDQFAGEVVHAIVNLRSLAQVQAAKANLEQFIDRSKHALSGPLQGIADEMLHLKDMVVAGEWDSDAANRRLNDLKGYCREAGQIVQRFTARVRLGGTAQLRTQYNFKRHNPGWSLSRAIDRYRSLAAKRDIEIKAPSSIENLPAMECDARALNELFDNLLDNAVKFAHSKTVIEVSGCVCSPGAVSGWPFSQNGQRFVFSDFGLGIPEEDLEKIFLPYVQSKVVDTRRVIPGTGLGLAICREIAEAHGGRILARCHASQFKPVPQKWQGCRVEIQLDLPDLHRGS